MGIKVNLFITLEQNTYPRRISGNFDVRMGGLLEPVDPMNSPHRWAITDPKSPFWHRNAEREGPDWLREATQHLATAMTSVEEETVRTAMERFRDLHSENVPVIGIGAVYKVWGANRRLGNVPVKTSQFNHVRAWSRPLFHEQLFIRN